MTDPRSPLSPEDAEAMARPRWQWVGIGALIAFLVWMPLLMLAVAYSNRALGAVSTLGLAFILKAVLPVLLSMALACSAGGALVGRFGGGVRDAVASGACTAFAAWGIAAASGSLPGGMVAAGSLFLLGFAGASGAYLGGRFGAGRRHKTPPDGPGLPGSGP